MTDRSDLQDQIKAKGVVHGAVTLSSGQQADWYVDLRRVLLDGRRRAWLAASCST